MPGYHPTKDPQASGSSGSGASTAAHGASDARGAPDLRGLSYSEQVQRLSPGGPSSAYESSVVQLHPGGGVGGSPVEEVTPLGVGRMLRIGSSGPDVVRAQERMNRHGATPPLDVDGLFGALTHQAVVRFQTAHGLSADGIVGPVTGAALEAEPGPGGLPAPPGTLPGPPGTLPAPPGTPPHPGTQPNKFERGDLNSRVDYDIKSKGRAIEGLGLPFDGPTKWDGHKILSQLSQVDRIDETKTDMARCVGNSTLAIAIMSGPLQVGNYASVIQLYASDAKAQPGLPAKKRALCDEIIAFCGGVQQRLLDGTATYADLSRLADYAKQLTSNPSGATSEDEMVSLQRAAGATEIVNRKLTSKDQLEKAIADALEPGSAVTLGVDINRWDGKREITKKEADHMVVLGRDAAGRVYLYDPLPRKGSQILYQNEPQFWTLFEADDVAPGEPHAFKPAFVVAKTSNPPMP